MFELVKPQHEWGQRGESAIRMLNNSSDASTLKAGTNGMGGRKIDKNKFSGKRRGCTDAGSEFEAVSSVLPFFARRMFQIASDFSLYFQPCSYSLRLLQLCSIIYPLLRDSISLPFIFPLSKKRRHPASTTWEVFSEDLLGIWDVLTYDYLQK